MDAVSPAVRPDSAASFASYLTLVDSYRRSLRSENKSPRSGEILVRAPGVVFQPSGDSQSGFFSFVGGFVGGDPSLDGGPNIVVAFTDGSGAYVLVTNASPLDLQWTDRGIEYVQPLIGV